MKKLKDFNFETLSPDRELIHYTELSEEPAKLKYKKLWKRVHIRLRTALRISRIMKSIRILNSNSLKNLNSENIGELFENTENLSRFSTKLLTSFNPLPRFIFHPAKGFKIYWNIFLGLCLLYTATVTPFLLAFITNRDFDVWFFIDIFLSVVFTLDLIFTLNTAYQDFDGILVTNRLEIFKNYLKGWFFIDFVACIPFDLIISFISPESQRASYNTLSKLIRLKNFPRLFRLSKLLVYFKDNENFPFLDNIYYFFSLSTSIIKFLNTFFTILISLHIISCLWYFTAKFDDFGPDTWIYRHNLFDLSTYEYYIHSLYWALVTLSTIGYGDIYAKTINERILSVFWMIVALYFLSFSISSLSTMISEKDSGRKRQMDKKLALIDSFVKENNLTRKIKSQMQKIVKEISEKHLYSFNEKQTLLEGFVPRIRIKVAQKAHYGALGLFEILNTREEMFVYSIIPLLKTVNMDAGKYLYKEGDPYKEIYFMIHGKAFYVTNNDVKFKVLSPGCYCGDIEVVNSVKRFFGIKIMEQSLFWVMGPELIRKIQLEFPMFIKDLKKNSIKRLDNIVLQLSEVKALQSVSISQITNLTYIRKMIENEFKNLRLQYSINQNEKNFISRIDWKLDECKKLITRNGKTLEDIEISMKSLQILRNLNFPNQKTESN